jgi:hypothetical protein
LSGTVSFADHDPVALGFFLRGTVPFAMNLEKFGNPRIDYLAGGWQLGVELETWLSYEAGFFFGSGTRPVSKDQNGAAALSNLFHFHAERWLLPWKVGVKLGPYVEGDIHERFDERYDQRTVGQPQAGGQPIQQRDRSRAALAV